jgi:hypothetical protein
MVFLGDFYAISMGVLCVSNAFSMIFLRDFYAISIGSLWDVYRISMVCL